MQALEDLLATATEKDPDTKVVFVREEDIRARILMLARIATDLKHGADAEKLTRQVSAMPKGKGAPKGKPSARGPAFGKPWSAERRAKFEATAAAKKAQRQNGHAPH